MKHTSWHKKGYWLLILFGLFQVGATTHVKKTEGTCISPEEKKLYDLIMTYRKELKLETIPLSASLCTVAMTHTVDLALNKPKSPCNLHSWSSSSGATPCCYTNDGKAAACMWSKPSELTNYKGAGYEIAAWFSDPETAEKALDQWKHSPGHNAVITNKGSWTSKKWKAIGLSIYKNYAVVWFGEESDTEPIPAICH